MLATFFASGAPRRALIGLLLALPGSVSFAAGGEAADTGTLHLVCTNQTGGANWPIVIDLDHGSVDSFPAKITDARISWRNANGGVFELERATGNLQLRAASSTGGFFLHYTCRPE